MCLKKPQRQFSELSNLRKWSILIRELGKVVLVKEHQTTKWQVKLIRKIRIVCKSMVSTGIS